MSQYLVPDNNHHNLPGPRRVMQASRRVYAAESVDPTIAPTSLRELLTVIRRRIWIILPVTLLATGLAYYYSSKQAPVYQATATIRLTDTRRSLTSGLADGGGRGGIGMRSDPVMTEIQVLTSRSLMASVADSLPLVRLKGVSAYLFSDFELKPSPADSLGYPTFQVSFGPTRYVVTTTAGSRQLRYGEPYTYQGLQFAFGQRMRKEYSFTVMTREDAAAKLAGSVAAKPRENTDVVDVTFRSTSPLLAQQVVNTLANVYQASNISAGAQAARLRREFVAQQLRQNDSLLTEARAALSAFRSRQQTYSARDQFTQEKSELTTLDLKRQEVEADQKLYRSVLARIQGGPDKGMAQDIGTLLSTQSDKPNQAMTDLYVQLQRLELSRDSMTTGPWASAATNPDVEKVNALIATTRDKMERTAVGILSSLDDKSAGYAKIRASNKTSLEVLPATGVEEARLVEREQAYAKVADNEREELQKAKLAEAAEVGDVSVIDLATRPRAPISATKMRDIIFGALLGLLLGGGCAFLVENLDTSIRGREEAESLLQLPGLAVIPKITESASRRRKIKANGSGNGSGPLVDGQPIYSQQLITMRDSRAVASEAYRHVRTKLLFSRAVSSLRTIVVTSPFAQDGKTTVTGNLATTFAQSGLRVLLIDCDLRRPTQHTIFQVACEPGLTELLAGQGLVAGTGRRTPIEGLHLITAGSLPADPAEALGSQRMREVLAKLTDAFDLVILDSPPVLPVADSTMLAGMTDGVVLVVRAGQTNRKAAQVAAQQLTDVGARMLGVVINDPNSKVADYDAYGYAAYQSYTSK